MDLGSDDEIIGATSAAVFSAAGKGDGSAERAGASTPAHGSAVGFGFGGADGTKPRAASGSSDAGAEAADAAAAAAAAADAATRFTSTPGSRCVDFMFMYRYIFVRILLTIGLAPLISYHLKLAARFGRTIGRLPRRSVTRR